jgi:hypothetical protein
LRELDLNQKEKASPTIGTIPTNSLIRNVNRHAGEKDLRHANAQSLNQRESGDQCGSGITEAGHQTDQRVETKTKFGSGEAQELVHDEREPFEKRLDPLVPSLFVRGKNFPIDFL